MLAHLSSLPRRLLRAAEVMAAAARAAGAAEGGRTPAASDLARLGIDPARFALIRHV